MQLAKFENKVVTMTSLDLVEFINSQRKEGEAELRHDHFMAKVPLVLGETVAPNFRGYYKASNGKQNPCYIFQKREACLMAMSYSYDLQAKVFDRMTVLEEATVKTISLPQNFKEALVHLLSSVEKNEELQAENDILAPKATALDRIATADGSMCLTDAAKHLQMKPIHFFRWLQANGWIYRRAGGSGYIGYQDKIQRGLLEHKINMVNREDGTEKMTEQVRVTAKGISLLSTKVEVAA